jgi:hypothetical protein
MAKAQRSSANRPAGVVIDPRTAQREYTRKLESGGFDFGLVVGDAFVRGIRDIGYRHTGTAIDELIDNAMQAGASAVHIVLGFEGGSDRKPDRLAVLDNGHGMNSTMIRAAMLWGGTHREDDRSGFGRYGYGLPSSCVSQGRRFTVYSIEEEGGLHKVTFDLDAVKEGNYTNAQGRIIMPLPEPAELPDWVRVYMRRHVGTDDLEHGTVVVIEQLDRLSWKTAKALKVNLLEHFGVTYRTFLRETALIVDGTPVEAVDPLFITPGMRFYDVDDERAQAMEPLAIPVKDSATGQAAGMIRIRYSYMPPTFQSTDKEHGGPPHNPRFAVMKAHRGVIVCRAGRQIDIVDSKCPWYTFVNHDRNWGVEIDFQPTLDEEFSITTSKQQVVLSERMWEILEQAGVKSAIAQLKKRFREDRARLNAETEKRRKRASERAMEEALKFKTRKATHSPERQKQNDEKFKQEVRRRAHESGMPEEQVERELKAEIEGRLYKLGFESLPGAPFFRVEQIGGQRVLLLNTAHRFFRDLYAGPGSSSRLRSGLEVLLFVIGDSELEAERERRLFYESERALWSQQLNVAMDELDQIDSIEDELSAADEEAENGVRQETGVVVA